jgi:hypothetical protein
VPVAEQQGYCDNCHQRDSVNVPLSCECMLNNCGDCGDSLPYDGKAAASLLHAAFPSTRRTICIHCSWAEILHGIEIVRPENDHFLQ